MQLASHCYSQRNLRSQKTFLRLFFFFKGQLILIDQVLFLLSHCHYLWSFPDLETFTQVSLLQNYIQKTPWLNCVIAMTKKAIDNKLLSISRNHSVCLSGTAFLVFNTTHCWEVRKKDTVFLPVIVIALHVSPVSASFL